MKGKEVKEILKREGLTIEEVAVAIGYGSSQRLHSALKSDDVKSGLLEKIAKATNKNVCTLYNIEVDNRENEQPSETDRLLELLSAKETSLAKAQEHIDKLLNIIAQLTTK